MVKRRRQVDGAAAGKRAVKKFKTASDFKTSKSWLRYFKTNVDAGMKVTHRDMSQGTIKDMVGTSMIKAYNYTFLFP
eukprot:1392821-Amorphochlora_amoeboformis.AAC.2